jgi:hypothetical protein
MLNVLFQPCESQEATSVSSRAMFRDIAWRWKINSHPWGSTPAAQVLRKRALTMCHRLTVAHTACGHYTRIRNPCTLYRNGGNGANCTGNYVFETRRTKCRTCSDPAQQNQGGQQQEYEEFMSPLDSLTALALRVRRQLSASGLSPDPLRQVAQEFSSRPGTKRLESRTLRLPKQPLEPSSAEQSEAVQQMAAQPASTRNQHAASGALRALTQEELARARALLPPPPPAPEESESAMSILRRRSLRETGKPHSWGKPRKRTRRRFGPG